MAPSWDAEWVLDVYPQADGFRCVGTTLQGLRCRQSFISRENKRRATAILDELPELIQCRIQQDTLLDDLYDIAWYTLCPRWHQTKKPQAYIISRRWLQTILDLEIRTRGDRTPSTSSGSTTSGSTSSSSGNDWSTSSSDDSDSSSNGLSDNSIIRSSNSTRTLGSYSSRSSTLRGSSSSSGSRRRDSPVGPLYPASRERSARPLSVTDNSHSLESGAISTSSSRTMRASTSRSNAPSPSANSALARTRQHWANMPDLPRIATRTTRLDQDRHGSRLTDHTNTGGRNAFRRSDAPSPSSSPASSSTVTSTSSPTTPPRSRRTSYNTIVPSHYNQHQLPTPVRTSTPDTVQSMVSRASQQPRPSISSISSRSSTARGTNHVIHLNLNLNVTLGGQRDRSNSGVETPITPTRHIRNTDSPLNATARSERRSSSGSSATVSTTETINELLAALEELAARFNSRSASSSSSTSGRRRRDLGHNHESSTLSPEHPLTPTRIINTPPSPGSPTELSFESPVIIYTPESSGPFTPVLVSTPLLSGLESPFFLSPPPSPRARIITGPPGISDDWYDAYYGSR